MSQYIANTKDEITFVTPSKGIYDVYHCSTGVYAMSKAHIDVPVTINAAVFDRLLMKGAGVRPFYGYNPKTNEVIAFTKTGPIRQKDLTKIANLGVTRVFQSAFFTKQWVVDGQLIPVTEDIDLSPEATTNLAMKYRGLF